MDKFKTYFPDKFKFVPKTFKLPEESEKLQKIMKR